MNYVSHLLVRKQVSTYITYRPHGGATWALVEIEQMLKTCFFFLLNKTKIKEIAYTKEQIKEVIKCSQDPEYFLHNYIKVISLDEGIVPSRPKRPRPPPAPDRSVSSRTFCRTRGSGRDRRRCERAGESSGGRSTTCRHPHGPHRCRLRAFIR